MFWYMLLFLCYLIVVGECYLGKKNFLMFVEKFFLVYEEIVLLEVNIFKGLCIVDLN